MFPAKCALRTQKNKSKLITISFYLVPITRKIFKIRDRFWNNAGTSNPPFLIIKIFPKRNQKSWQKFGRLLLLPSQIKNKIPYNLTFNFRSKYLAESGVKENKEIGWKLLKKKKQKTKQKIFLKISAKPSSHTSRRKASVSNHLPKSVTSAMKNFYPSFYLGKRK